jgi:microcystin-dependent protein
MTAQDITNKLGSSGSFKVQDNSSAGLLTITSSGNATLKGTLTVANGSTAFTLPTSDGTPGQVITTNGSGTLSWKTPTVRVQFLICTSGEWPGGNTVTGFFIGQIVMTAAPGAYTIPSNFLLCDGSLLSISSYTALFSLLGTTYGGNGTTNFALPNFTSLSPEGGL